MADLTHSVSELSAPWFVPSLAYTGPYSAAELAPVAVLGRKDYLTGMLGQGIGRVRGETVEKSGALEVPVCRKVRLHRERDGILIREQWSDPVTGAYDFQFIDELQVYTTLAYDSTGTFRAVVADGQIPELMP